MIAVNNYKMNHLTFLMALAVSLTGCGLQLTEQAPEANAKLQLASSSFIEISGQDSLSFARNDPTLDYEWSIIVDGYAVDVLEYAKGDAVLEKQIHSLPSGGVVTISGTQSDPLIEYQGPGEKIKIDYCLEVRDSRNFESMQRSCDSAFLAPIQAQVCSGLPQFTVGGSVVGLPPGETIRIRNGEDSSVIIGGNGGFTFPIVFAPGDDYNINIAETSTGTKCAVTNGSGVVGEGNVSNVKVVCTDERPVVAGTLNTQFCGNKDVIMKVNGMSRGIYTTSEHENEATITNNGSTKVFSVTFTTTDLKKGDRVEVVVKSASPQDRCTAANNVGVYGIDDFLSRFNFTCDCPGP